MPEEEQANVALKIFNDWKSIIESHSQYIINYFLSMAIINFGLLESWDEWWCLDKDLGEEELSKLREEKEKQFLSEVDLYLDKEGSNDIRNLYKKYLPYFDYDKFLSTIELEYLTIDVDRVSIQLSDNKMEFFCAAYINFDKDLNGYDWHNF